MDDANQPSNTEETSSVLQKVNTEPVAASDISRSIIKQSTVAVLSGIFTVVALSLGTDFLLQMYGVIPEGPIFDESLLLIILGYRIVYAVLAGYLTASLSPSRGMLHAFAIGIVGTSVSTLGIFMTADQSPLWYPVALALSIIPCVLAGAKIHEHGILHDNISMDKPAVSSELNGIEVMPQSPENKV